MFKLSQKELKNLKIALVDMYYHGTNSKANYEKIKQEGLQPSDVSGIEEKYRGKLDIIPIENAVYLTKELWVAGGYAIQNNNEAYGYILAFSTDKPVDVYPDEDSIGEFISNLMQDIESGRSVTQFQWLLDMVTDSELLQRVIDRDHDSYALLGKLILPQLTFEQRKTLVENREIDNVYIRNQVLKPDKAYRIKVPKQFPGDWRDMWGYVEDNIEEIL